MDGIYRFQTFESGKAKATSAFRYKNCLEKQAANDTSPKSSSVSSTTAVVDAGGDSSSIADVSNNIEEVENTSLSVDFFSVDTDPSSHSVQLAPSPQILNSGDVMSTVDTEIYLKPIVNDMALRFPYVNLFPGMAENLFATSTQHPALRESVLYAAISIHDRQYEGQKAIADQHLQQALQLLQTRISLNDMDEGLAITCFLLADMCMMIGDCIKARKHLRGMRAVLNTLSAGGSTQGFTLPPGNLSPLLMLVRRMAIRVDFIVSIACGQSPILPGFVPTQLGSV